MNHVISYQGCLSSGWRASPLIKNVHTESKEGDSSPADSSGSLSRRKRILNEAFVLAAHASNLRSGAGTQAREVNNNKVARQAERGRETNADRCKNIIKRWQESRCRQWTKITLTEDMSSMWNPLWLPLFSLHPTYILPNSCPLTRKFSPGPWWSLARCEDAQALQQRS